MINTNLNFVSNTVKGIQATSKRLKIFEYLKNYVMCNGFIFLQETHSSIKDEKTWKDEFKGDLFFLTEKLILAELQLDTMAPTL